MPPIFTMVTANISEAGQNRQHRDVAAAATAVQFVLAVQHVGPFQNSTGQKAGIGSRASAATAPNRAKR